MGIHFHVLLLKFLGASAHWTSFSTLLLICAGGKTVRIRVCSFLLCCGEIERNISRQTINTSRKISVNSLICSPHVARAITDTVHLLMVPSLFFLSLNPSSVSAGPFIYLFTFLSLALLPHCCPSAVMLAGWVARWCIHSEKLIFHVNTLISKIKYINRCTALTTAVHSNKC